MSFLSSCPSGSVCARGVKHQRYQNSSNFSGGKFTYPIPTNIDCSAKALLSVMMDLLKPVPGIRPRNSLPVQTVTSSQLQADETASSIFWLGHSTLLIRLSGKTILIDPVFSPYSSPFRFGGNRYSNTLPITLEQIPYIDTVLISHDHYDHLDRHSIRKLKDKVGHFHVPLGVGQHLERWGVDPQQITELDWWEEAEWAGIQLACTPARHNSGRGLWGQNITFWCSWRIADRQHNLFYSGDSGYGPHFAAIGDTYGPFDIAMIECGQYDKKGWRPYHMLPEQTIQASLDVQARQILPVHWGTFTLSRHKWDEPVERVLQAAKRCSVAVVTPKIGESVALNTAQMPQTRWWRAFV